MINPIENQPSGALPPVFNIDRETDQTSLTENVSSAEIPENFVPLYISIRKESLDFVRQNGFRVEDNQMAKRNPEVEKIFSQVGREMGFTIDRTKCVFAYPRNPDAIRHTYYDKNRDILVQVLVDPKNCIVAEGDHYAGAVSALMSRLSPPNEEEAKACAEAYWGTTEPLERYLQEGHVGEWEDLKDYNFPEVLIPSNIPTDRIKIVTDYEFPNV